MVPNRVKWPQEFVLSGFKKERIQYDQLSVVQWVAGYCRILREEQDPQVRGQMLDYMIALMEDAHDFSWDAARASHAVLLCRMEQGEVKNYTETGILKMPATSSPLISNLLGVACQKLPYLSNQVALISPCWLCSPKINWWEKNKTGSLEGDSTLQCDNKDTGNEEQGTTTSMHKLIIDHIQTGNSEPPYQEMTLESSTSLEYDSNSNSNSTFIALNLCQKTDSKAHHTKTLINIQKPETLQGSAPRRKQKGNWKFRVGMLFQRGMTSTLT